MSDLYTLKMRASRKTDGRDVHISGAEKIVTASDIEAYSKSLIDRGMHHDKGEADFLNLKLTKINSDKIQYLDALKVETIDVATYEQGHLEIIKFLKELGIEDTASIMRFLTQTYSMRGAMLLDVDRCDRLEPDKERGIRATNMDKERVPGQKLDNHKNHYEEAIVLATKVVNCPGILGEICISDDPEYVTGYVSSKEIGYRRITKMKEYGSENGGRIFLFRGNEEEVKLAVDYLQNQPVIVRNVQPIGETKATSKWDAIDNTLTYLRNNNLYRSTKAIGTAQSSHVRLDGKEYVLLASNDYLDIANYSRVRDCVNSTLSQYGFGSGGSRLTTGNTVIHDLLERKIADFKGTQAAIVFNTGYVANLATIEAICNSQYTIYSDELNHASIIDGCRLSKAKIVTYRHNDMMDLRQKILDNPCRNGLVVSDAVFSMDGDILNYPEFLNICEEFNLFSMVDEAHATGVIGETGRGIKEYWNETRNADILMGTLSKAVGGEGGYVAGENRMIDFLRNKARGYIFSTSFSPAVAAGNIEGINVIENEPWRVKKLQENASFFRKKLLEIGVKVNSTTAIIPVIIGDEKRTVELSDYLMSRGFYVSPIRFPTVAKGKARLRIAIMSSHTHQELAECVRIIGEFVENI